LLKDWIIAGKVVSGAGEGAYFTRINWVQEQCDERLGFKPYPGTLNLEISNEYLPIIESLNREEGESFSGIAGRNQRCPHHAR
jgi:CTP-dependent riboflavin kinase